MDQRQLAELAKSDPQLVAQILLLKQKIATDPRNPAGAPPQYHGYYPVQGRAYVTDSQGNKTASPDLANNDPRAMPSSTPISVGRPGADVSPQDDTVLGTMGNVLGNRMRANESDAQSRAAMANFKRRKYYGEPK